MLLNVFINSHHVFCLAHILNLVREAFSHWLAFDNITQLLSSSQPFLKKLVKKAKLQWLDGSLLKEQVKLLLVPVATRWNSWFSAAKYPLFFYQFYEGFFKQEKSHGLAVDRILELVNDGRLYHASYYNLCLNLYFI